MNKQIINPGRRDFLRTSGIIGGGLVVGFNLTGCGTSRVPFTPEANAFSPNAFLQITPDNTVTFYCPRDEMGQGVTTGLTTLVAEELDIDPAKVTVALATAHPDYANPMFGIQGTGGSTSIPAHYEQLRQVGADTRALLIEAAAGALGAKAAALQTEDGAIVYNGVRHPFGEFVGVAAQMQMAEGAPLKSASQFKYIGKQWPRLDGLAKATGTAEFGIDVDIPGMHHAVVVRAPVMGGVVAGWDATTARQMAGVTDVLEIGSGVAVVAQKYWQAKQAADQLEVQWELPELAKYSTADIQRDYAAALDSDEGVEAQSEGDLKSGFEKAAHVIEQDFWAPYLVHAPMEPMNAVVHIEGEHAQVWSGTQGPPAAAGLVARYADLDADNVTVHQTYLGGGFGRRATLTHIIEATQVAKATGKPIKVLWTREDDIRSGIYRPASMMRIKAGVDQNGQITAWQARRAGGNITPDTLKNMLPSLIPALGDTPVNWVVGMANSVMDGWVVDGSSVEGLFEDYDLPNHEVTHASVNHGLPLTFWRSVGHSYTAFAKEVMVDELAHQSGIDPVELRVRNAANNPRLQNVIRVAGEHMAKMQPVEGRSLGFAAHGSFGTDVAQVAEVSVENGQIRVHKVLCVVDCGIAVNPDVVRAQMEGGVMFGLTAALHGDIQLNNGAVEQSNFHDYPILRMNEAPEVEVVLIDSGTPPTGAGEPGLPPIAPAVANAVFAATGQRLTSMPFKLG